MKNKVCSGNVLHQLGGQRRGEARGGNRGRGDLEATETLLPLGLEALLWPSTAKAGLKHPQ